ncbi:MAG: sigma-70 family RNA polymerase sigma factor [Clostridia bacterium]|nr:sigma-70 family RNA polymerase sigma factor [Clostridia bacterium]
MDEKRRIVEKHFDMIYKLALAQTKNREHAEDVVQEVFLRYIKSDTDFENDEHIKAWLIRVTINCSRSIFASSWHKKTVPLLERDEKIIFDTHEKSDVYYAVMELPQKYRAVIHLFYYEDMSIEDISKNLAMNPSTVKSQLSRGRKLLKEKLKGGYDFV